MLPLYATLSHNYLTIKGIWSASAANTPGKGGEVRIVDTYHDFPDFNSIFFYIRLMEYIHMYVCV